MPAKSKFEISIHNGWAPVCVEYSEDKITVALPEGRLTVDVVEFAAGSYSLLIESRSYEATVTIADGRYWVCISGKAFEILLRDPKRFQNRMGLNADHSRPVPVSAPMPGKIVQLLVQEGEVVVEGQGVAVVEAMKMQNELRAPRSGRVEGIRVAENQAVNAGECLLVIQ
jgi:biotin carboxyl carrier protein